MHSGCLELIANDSVHSVADLRGKKVGVQSIRTQPSPYVLVTLMAAYVGLNPTRDIEWVATGDQTQLFIEGKIDAFLASPPEPQELRDRHIGHTILATSVDQPWSQYYC
jgi:NitT/TauT family transport system substrate-binding protein